jgi:2-polyprenyl-6-methoxyphenol hydroxylase-like FAD-dependent oxidoreductase
VIGGGPSGACAAETLAKGGVETFLLERKMDNCKVQQQQGIMQQQSSRAMRICIGCNACSAMHVAVSQPKKGFSAVAVCGSDTPAVAPVVGVGSSST